MNPILWLSLLVRLGALGWSLVILVRLKDWRMAFLAVMCAVLVARATMTLLGAPGAWAVTGAAMVDELPGLVLAFGALAAVIFLGRAIGEKGRVATELAAANQDLRQEIASRAQAQARLAESQRMLATLMGNLPGMVYRCRSDADRTMMFCSEGCRALTGYDFGSLVGNRETSFADLIHPGDRDRVWQAVQAAVAESRSFELTYRIQTYGGEEKWVWEHGCAVSQENGAAMLEGFITDITEKKIVEDQLRQAQKMEVVGQLTGGIAHDFNNLLAIMIGNLELAAEAADPNGEQYGHIGRALAAAERGATLTRQLLAFSRKQILQPQLVNLNNLVPRTTELFHRALGETIEIETVLTGGLWKIMVDPAQLEHALLNLAINARDAMPRGGRLTIETANIRLDEEYRQLNRFAEPGPYVMLAVSDTGTGMAPEVAARAFEPFFTTKEVGKGSGLGLSMVYGFVKQSGGHVQIYSEVGRGTTVKLYFPRARDQATPVIERRIPAPPPGGRSILPVADDADIERILRDARGESR